MNDYDRYKPKPHEGGIIGHWLCHNGKTFGDQNTGRINWLIANYFKKISTQDGGWTTNYQDPEDDSHWQLTYPKGYMHGGGPPMLERVSPITHAYKFIKDRIQLKLQEKLYDRIEEEFDFEAFGSRYIVWSNHQKLIRLVWDGKDGAFRFEKADSPLSSNTSWEELVFSYYTSKSQENTDLNQIANDILNSI